ncbi:MAG: hypothetical protein N2378_07505 [Chloroflexaceae bacterium]|nr:hypothetical protein [Chloroflexaceae bacterium]
MPRTTLQRTVLLLVLMISLPGAPASSVHAQETPPIWSRVAGIPADVTLVDVVMPGPEVAWAVGSQEQEPRGVVYRLSLAQNRWHVTRDATFDQPLSGVAALDAERVVVVGGAGLIARRNAGGAWAREDPGIANLWLSAVQLFDDGRAGWAMGAVDGTERDRAVALRLNDGRWTEAGIEDPGSDSYVEAIHFFAPGVGWAVGSHIWYLRGNEWRLDRQLEFCPGDMCRQQLSGVRAIDAERAWLVGTRRFMCMFCPDQIVMGRHDASGWHDAFPEGTAAVLPPLAPGHYDSAMLSGLTFVGADDGLAVGWRRYQDEQFNFVIQAFALRYSRGAWSYETLGERIVPSHVAMADATHALVVGYGGLLLSYGYGEQGAPPEAPAGNPARPVPDPGLPEVRYFAPTGHTLRGAFRGYWEANGGLERFGYPLTEEFTTTRAEDGRTYTVQYFERARFEAHPEHQGTRYAVLLGLLGRELTAGRADEAPFRPIGPPRTADTCYFPETGHRIAPEFAGFWREKGGLPIFGYPISEPFTEINAADGQPYLVQYFERSRFEYHPGAGGPPGKVMLGLLGSEYLRRSGIGGQ